MNKKSAAFLAAMLIATTFSSLLLFNVNTAVGSTLFDPVPPPPGGSSTNWNFDEGDKVSWQVDIFMDNAFMGSELLIYNISDITVGQFNMSSIRETFDDYYLIELTEMYYNTTMDSLMEIPNRTLSPIVNASLLSFTYMEMYADSEMEMPIPNYFLPDNGSTGLYLEDCAKGLLNYYGSGIPSYNMTYTINTTYDNELFFYDYGMPDFLVDPFTNSYVDLVYFNNGTLNFGEVFMNLSGAPFYMFEMRMIYTRNFDFNEIDEVVWGVEVGDVFYAGVGLNETKVEIVGIENMTDEEYWSWQIVLVNESIWDFELEQWNFTEGDILAGQANEYAFMPGEIVPYNTTGEDLAAFFGNPFSGYDYVEYGEYYMYVENTSSGAYMEMEYYISGIPNYISVYDADLDETEVIFYKNMTVLSTVGIHSFDIEPYGIISNFFNVTTDVNITDSTEYYFRCVPDNPTEVSLPIITDALYIDLMVNTTANVNFPINLTIEYDTMFSGLYQLWNFEASLDDWVEVPIYDDDEGTLTAQLDHTSIYGLSVVLGDSPGPFTASSNAGTPDTDGDFTISWGVSNGADNYTLWGSVDSIDYYEIENGLTNHSMNFYDIEDGEAWFIVTAFNETGSTDSNTVYVLVDRPEPPGPFVLTTDANSPDEGNFYLNWTRSSGAENYSVYISYQYITEINITTLELVDDTIVNSSEIIVIESGVYYFAVLAQNGTGETFSNNIIVEVLLPPGPFELDSTAGTPDADGAFRLTWNESIDADNYTVYSYSSYITEINGTINKLTTTEITDLYYDITGVPDGTTIYYIIEAHNLIDNTSSNCIAVVVVYGPPGAFALSSNAGNPDEDGNFNLSWDPADGAKNYTIYVSSSFIIEINGNGTAIANTTGLSLVLSKPDGTYYYVVVAFNDYGNTTSNCVKVVVLIPEKDGDDGDDDDSGKDEGSQIPFGNFFLIFIAISVIALVYYKRRKL